MFILKNNPSLRRMRLMRRDFGTTCTQKDTRVTKFLAGAHYTQALGRSMVEMLGVLAIIGVLSVGAIAGYSKAMMKYKLNKQAEQLNTIINAVACNAHNFANLKQSTNLTGTFIKMGEIPKEMAVSYDGYIYDIFKNYYHIAYELFEDGTKRVTLFMNSQLETKSVQNLEICRNMLITAKENSANITQLEGINGWGTDDYNIAILYGDQKCSTGKKCLKI
jgi:hypothetical protein